MLGNTFASGLSWWVTIRHRWWFKKRYNLRMGHARTRGHLQSNYFDSKENHGVVHAKRCDDQAFLIDLICSELLSVYCTTKDVPFCSRVNTAMNCSLADWYSPEESCRISIQSICAILSHLNPVRVLQFSETCWNKRGTYIFGWGFSSNAVFIDQNKEGTQMPAHFAVQTLRGQKGHLNRQFFKIWAPEVRQGQQAFSYRQLISQVNSVDP